MRKLALDTNCFIDAFSQESHAFDAMQTILALASDDRLDLYVSVQSLSELKGGNDDPERLARSLKQLPHFRVGSWNEQIESWKNEGGTWEESREDEKRQKLIHDLANTGNSIRDRGGYIDAIRSNLDAFVTSDGQFTKPVPASTLNRAFRTKVLKPQQVVEQLAA
jgi:hypothetical protein